MGKPRSGRRCLVTGHTGYIGRALVRALEEGGHNVEGLAEADGTFVDLLDHQAVARVVERVRPHTLFHMGGVSGPMCHADDPVQVLMVNVVGSEALLNAAAKYGVSRIVTAGSVAGYARPGPFGPEPDNVYGLTKRVLELQTRLWARRTGREATCVRIGSVYGVGRQTENPIHKMVSDALRTNEIRYESYRMEPCIEIGTCVSLIAALADVEHLRPRYDAVTERPCSSEVAGIVAKLTGAKHSPHMAENGVHPEFPEDFDSSALSTDAGQIPHATLENAIFRIIRSYDAYPVK
ncbi:NAD-dependent epimerase/dehydratase family protein [Shinella daejeonensis]|uniref:NAD-dependent epimerase/dehydratase family protein n=1 Tax=Shinella daejeonensis TaxID=659017 RepID=UPI0020C8059E|nr:NAD-dependent epimerase/dehydratase family protein [Shinella daejeonensis]